MLVDDATEESIVTLGISHRGSVLSPVKPQKSKFCPKKIIIKVQ